MAVLRCDACGGDTFEATAEPGFFRCHSCGAASSVKLVATTVPVGHGGLRLARVGAKKIEVIKVIREHTGLGLKEAKEIADAAERAPQVIALTGADAGAVERFAADLAAAGATVER